MFLIAVHSICNLSWCLKAKTQILLSGQDFAVMIDIWNKCNMKCTDKGSQLQDTLHICVFSTSSLCTDRVWIDAACVVMWKKMHCFYQIMAHFVITRLQTVSLQSMNLCCVRCIRWSDVWFLLNYPAISYNLLQAVTLQRVNLCRASYIKWSDALFLQIIAQFLKTFYKQ